jgi:hypothetical protein
MRIFVLTATYELRESRKSHLRDHPIPGVGANSLAGGWVRGPNSDAGTYTVVLHVFVV